MKKERDFPYLPAIIALSAALVASIVMLANRMPALKSLVFVLSFLVGFYIVGSILRAILIANATKVEEEEENEEDLLEDIQTSEGEQE